MNFKSRWFATVTALIVVTAGGLFLTNALGHAKRPASQSISLSSLTPSTPAYGAGSFTFTTPQQLIRPPIPVTPGVTLLDQDVEPEIKVDLFGNIYLTAIHGVPGGVDLWKSTDQGATFAYLGEPDGAQDKCDVVGTVPCTAGAGGGDDSIDVSADGYLYVSSLWLGNVTMSASYDGGVGGAVPGQKWEVNPAAAETASDDRQWVAAYGPQTVGMTFNNTAPTRPPGNIGLFFVKSTDGGKTFGPLVEITATASLDSVNVEGNLVVDPYTGNFYTTYIPLNQNNVIRFASSTDGGMTWNISTAYTGPAGTTNRGVFPIMSVDRGGNVHLVFTRSDDTASNTNCHIFLMSTANATAGSPTWTSPIQIDNNGTSTGTACLAWPVAGSPGAVDITWLGSSGASPSTAPFDWHVYFAQVSNALGGSPLVVSNQAETAQMHNTTICFSGGACATGTRKLAEYYTITLDRDGNANIAYSDSINGTCGSESNCNALTWFTKQTGGSIAYNPPAAPGPATFRTNLAVPNSGGTAEPNGWVDSHNCVLGGSIGGPIDFISKDAGFNFTEHSVVVGTGIHGGDFHLITMPNADGSRPDQIYTADLGVTTVHIGKSTDGGNTYFQPGTGGIAGEVSVSSDRMWLWPDRGIPNATDQTVYLMDHEFTTEAIRFAALTNDFAWSAFTPGMTSSELILPPTSSLPNTNPGPVFVSPTTHSVFGIFAASTITTNSMAPPFGKEPNIWDAIGAPPAAQGLAPGPFTNFPVFKGVIDAPVQAPSPAPTIPPSAVSIGNHSANIFPSGVTDKVGNVYVVWSTNSTRYNVTQANGQPSNSFDVWFAASHDGGQNFYGPWRVSSGTGTAIFPWIAAGDAGMVDISFYQSNSIAPPLVADPTNPGALTGGPNNMPAGATWNVMFAQSLNADSREPVFTVSQASDHVIHTGSISNGGTFGSSDRSLLDFFQVAIGPDGLANIFSADNGTSGEHINYVRQNGGPLAVANPSNVTCLPAPPNPVSAVSRKNHGAAGNFDIDLLPPATGIEDRIGSPSGKDFQIVVTFPAAVTVSGASVSSRDNLATADAPGGSGTTTITVNLHNVSNAQRLTLTLIDVSSGNGDLGNVGIPMAVLLGDVNANGIVDGNDIANVQSQTRQSLNGNNFRDDVNTSGTIDGNDVSITQGQTRTSLP